MKHSPHYKTLQIKVADLHYIMDKILKRWKEYFSTILNSNIDELSSNYRIQITKTDIRADPEILPPSYSEVCSIINKLKVNKAGGTNNIIPELIKQGGRTSKQRIHKLITIIWEEEQLPNQWNEGIICPVYKKGGKIGLHELQTYNTVKCCIYDVCNNSEPKAGRYCRN